MKKFIIFFGLLFISCNICFADQPTQIVNGRYVMYQHPTFRGEQYILDTKTGKTWQLVQTKEGITVWEQRLYDCYNDDKTYSGRFVNPK